MQFDYIRSHKEAGMNELILRSHPGGAIVEIGGGVQPRFPSRTPSERPTIINIEKQQGATGDVVVEQDLCSLEDGLHDPAVRPFLGVEGSGTVVMSHVLGDLPARNIQELIRSSVQKLAIGGNVFIMRSTEAQMKAMLRRTTGGSMVAAARLREKFEELTAYSAAIDAGIADVSTDCRVHMATLLPLVRLDAHEKMTTPLNNPSAVMQRLWDQVTAKKMHFVLAENIPESGEQWITAGPTHKIFRSLSQHVTVLTKGANENLEQGWNALLQKKGVVEDQYRVWLRAQRKTDKKKK